MEETPKGLLPVKWWNDQFTNCQSNPLLSEMNLKRSRELLSSQPAKFGITVAGPGSCMVCSRLFYTKRGTWGCLSAIFQLGSCDDNCRGAMTRPDAILRGRT